MGDSGALFIGLMVSVLGIMLKFSSVNTYTSWMIPILILGVPIFDTTLVVVSRLRRGLAPSRSPGKDHVAHRLANVGLGESGAVICMYLASVAWGGLALLVTWLTIPQAYILGGITIVMVGIALAWLERAPYERQEPLHRQG